MCRTKSICTALKKECDSGNPLLHTVLLSKGPTETIL